MLSAVFTLADFMDVIRKSPLLFFFIFAHSFLNNNRLGTYYEKQFVFLITKSIVCFILIYSKA